MESRAHSAQGGDGLPAVSIGRIGLRLALPSRARAQTSDLTSVIDIGCVLAIVVAVVVVGVRYWLGLPAWCELVGEAAAAILLVLVAISLRRRGTTISLPYVALAFFAIVVVGGVHAAVAADSSDDLILLAGSAKVLLFLPALAFGLAALGAGERRNRMVLIALVAIAVGEFGISIIQGATLPGIDDVTGTFGVSSSWVLAFAMEVGACAALGVYGSAAGGRMWLALGALLPLFSIWADTRINIFVVPLAGGAVCAATWLADRRPPEARRRSRRWLPVTGAVLISSTAVVAGFVIFRPSSVGLNELRQRVAGLGTAEAYAASDNHASAVGHGGGSGGALVPKGGPSTATSYRINPGATLDTSTTGSATGRPYLQITTPGEQDFEGVDYAVLHVTSGTTYRISAYVAGTHGKAQLYAGDGVVGSSSKIIHLTRGWKRYTLRFTPKHSGKTGVALRTTKATPQVFYLDAAHPRMFHVAAAAAAAATLPPPALSSLSAQISAAWRLIDGTPVSALLGNGLGTDTFQVLIGVEPPGRDALLASYADFSILLAELGLLGVIVAGACALGLALGSAAAAARTPEGSWTRALLIGYPGVLVAIAAATIHGVGFHVVGSSTIFWVLTGLVLASILSQEPTGAPAAAARPLGSGRAEPVIEPVAE